MTTTVQTTAPRRRKRPRPLGKLARLSTLPAILVLSGLGAGPWLSHAHAQTPAQNTTGASTTLNANIATPARQLPRIDVVGKSVDRAQDLPGSVAVISAEQLQLQQAASVQDALKSVPGITVREEEGYGFIPNIGLRGLNPNRSQKLLVLEDGVPVAPGLFLANESYYSPRIERMESIEVLKGAAGLRYGPTTIGGVINYKTKPPEEGVKLTTRIGSHGYRLMGIDAGGTNTAGDAIGGLSLVTARGDGLRHNGFDMTDLMLKGGMALGDRQWVSAKFTRYENDINTSYVGLRPNEFRTTPTKNPAPDDVFLTERTSFDINHEVELNPQASVQTLFYWSQLKRDYWRRNVASRTADGTTFVPCTGGAACLVGRNRTFEMVGVDSRLFLEHQSLGLKQQTELGIRVHRDSLRNQTVSSNVSPNARSGTLTGDDHQKANGLALYAQNRMELTPTLAITPGLRVEQYDQSRRNELTGVGGTSDNTEVIPGVGFTWQLHPSAQLFGGVFKGFSPAMVATAISAGGVDQQLEAERSTNVEVGVRGQRERLSWEATFFRMDFDNQIVPQSESGGVGATSTNAGKTLHQGLEAGLGYELGQGWSVSGNLTYLPTARYNSTKVVAGLDRNGNRLPYAPELTSYLALNYKSGGLTTTLSAQTVSAQFVDPENTVAESTDGRRGEIPAYTTVNLAARYAVNRQLTVFGVVRNLLDETYINSRNPDGIFPGAERNVEVGLSYKF
jgi:Fe(3+) dicitrate transport protein